jgi:hypothetical protein
MSWGVVVLLAGFAADEKYSNKKYDLESWHYEGDRLGILELYEFARGDWNYKPLQSALHDNLLPRTRSLVDKHWTTIEYVADYLLSENRISRKPFLDIMEQHDIKPMMIRRPMTRQKKGRLLQMIRRKRT